MVFRRRNLINGAGPDRDGIDHAGGTGEAVMAHHAAGLAQPQGKGKGKDMAASTETA